MLNTLTRCSFSAFFAAVLLFTSYGVLAETPAQRPGEVPPIGSSFSVTRNLVLLNVSVRKSDGMPVTDLTARDFRVYEEGQEQEIVFFQEQNSPFQLMLLLDTSSSMKGDPLVEARRAASEMIESIPPGEVALMTFNHIPRLVEQFTRDSEAIRAAVMKTGASGGTALYDAIVKALEEFDTLRDRRQILVLLSDGKDEDSFTTFSKLEHDVQSSLVTIYSIGEYSESERILYQEAGKHFREPKFDANLNPIWILQELAELTGGLSFFPRKGENLSPIFKEILADLKSQYLVGYEASGTSTQSEFREIGVRLRDPDRFGEVTVRTRSGYRVN